ncbi:MAG TPA: FG-GAP-like repeat-containing protein [bacterium]|nr:FG-GAP-like repeat-containing protein [bacterium]HPG46138.1 FG-GAP-like repeat-containing protein [bacterium]
MTSLRNCLFASLCCTLVASAQTIKLTDVTDAMQAWGRRDGSVSAFGHGVAFADISGDGLPDLYISSAVRGANNNMPETLYISRRGAPYSEEDYKRGIEDKYGMTGSHGVCFADFDNDGDLDLFNATTDDRIRLYRNRGDGFFTDFSDNARLYKNRIYLETYGEIGYGTRGIVAFDANSDGHLDLLGVNWGPVEDANFVPWPTPPQPNEFYLNLGNTTFRKTDNSGLTLVNPSHVGTQGVTAIDVDNDDDLDVFISHRNYAYLGQDSNGQAIFGPGDIPVYNQLFINDGKGNFTDQAEERGLATNPDNDCNGTTFFDFDNDGDLDAFVVPKTRNKNVRVYRNLENGYFDDISGQVQIAQWGFSLIPIDLDNDGDLDIVAPRTYSDISIYLNDGKGSLTRISNTGAEIPVYDPRGAGVADIDGDADLDFYFADANKNIDPRYSNRLFRNDTRTSNRWLKVTGRGPQGDQGAMGSKIWVFEAGHLEEVDHLIGYRQVQSNYGYLCQDDPVQHFGVGARDRVDVKIRMVDKTTLRMRDVPVNQTLHFSKPQVLDLAGGDHQTGSAGTLLGQPLRVRVSDRYRGFVAGAAVLFSAASGSIVENQPVYSDADGYAQIHFRLPDQSGFLLVSAQLVDSPAARVDFALTSESPAGCHLEIVSGDGQIAAPGELLPAPLEIALRSGQGLPYPGQSVVFRVLTGGGTIGDQVSAEVTTDADGRAQAHWRLGETTGEQKIQVFVAEEREEQVEFKAYARRVPAALEFVLPNKIAGIAGQPLEDSLTVRVVDSSNMPAMDCAVEFAIVSGDGRVNGSNTAIVLSDKQGLARCEWRLGPKSGSQTQQVRINAYGLQNSPILLFADVAPREAYALQMVAGDRQTGYLGALLEQELVCAVVDTFGNAIVGHPLRFEVRAGSAFFSGQNYYVTATDSTGQAAAQLTLGVKPGKIEVSATAYYNNKKLIHSPLFWIAYAQQRRTDPSLSSINATSPVRADGRETAQIAAVLRDSDSFPVVNAVVEFHVAGAEAVLQQSTALTAKDGTAVTELRSTRSGWKKVWATIDGEPAVADTAHILFIAGPPARLALLDSLPRSAVVGQPIKPPIVAVLSDSFANGVPNIALSISLYSPSGHLHSLTTASTDSAGRAVFSPVLGTQSGIYPCVIAFEELVPLELSILAVPSPVKRLIKVSGDEQSGRRGQELPAPIVARALDDHENPIAGARVEFKTSSGSGFVSGENPLPSDESGNVQVRWTLGVTEIEQLEAVLVGVQESSVSFIAYVLPNQAPSFTPLPDTTITEMQPFEWMVQAADPDSDSLRLTVDNLPREAQFEPLSGRFSWQPHWDQAGDYAIVFHANDGFGGSAQTVLKIKVLNFNRQPVVLGVFPEDSLVHAQPPQTLSFHINCVDPDGDSLNYRWTVNDLPFGNGTEAAILVQPNLPMQSLIRVVVADQESQVEHRWHLDLISKTADNPQLPERFALLQNYPNPFNPETFIPLQLPVAAHVRLMIFSTTGQCIRTLVDQHLSAGMHKAVWDGCDDNGLPLPSGCYICVMSADRFVAQRKMVLLK